MKLKALLMSVPVWLSICHPDHNQDRLIQHPSGNDSGVTIADTVSPKQQADPGKQKEYTVTNLNNSEQLVFANGKVIDVWEYPSILKKIPLAAFEFEDEHTKTSGIIDFKKVPRSITTELVKDMYKDPKVKVEHILKGIYTLGGGRYAALNTGVIELNIDIYAYIDDPRDVHKVGGIAEIYLFNASGSILKTLDLKKYGLTNVELTTDGKYILIKHTGEEFDSEQSKDSPYNPSNISIYDTKSWNLIFETLKVPIGGIYLNKTNCFMSDDEYFTYIFKPSTKKVYKKNIPDSIVWKFKEWTDDGLYLTDGTVYLYDRDWQVETFDEYNKSNASQ